MYAQQIDFIVSFNKIGEKLHHIIIINLFYSKMIKVFKAFSNLGAFLILIVGLFMCGITVYGYIRSELIFN